MDLLGSGLSDEAADHLIATLMGWARYEWSATIAEDNSIILANSHSRWKIPTDHGSYRHWLRTIQGWDQYLTYRAAPIRADLISTYWRHEADNQRYAESEVKLKCELFDLLTELFADEGSGNVLGAAKRICGKLQRRSDQGACRRMKVHRQMKVLMVYNHYPVSSGKYIKKALRARDIEVMSVGPEHGTAIWGMHVPTVHVDSSGWTPGCEFEADLILIADSDPALLNGHTIKSECGQRADVPVVVYGVDNHVRLYDSDGIDHYFFAHHWPALNDMNAENVSWLPCGYDEDFTPSKIPWSEREWDVMLVGVMYPQRNLIMHRLVNAGLKVGTMLGAIGDDYIAAYHNARIALNVSANHDLSQRIFETAALGCIVVTDRIPDLHVLPKTGYRRVVGAWGETQYLGTQYEFPIWEVDHPEQFEILIPKLIEGASAPNDFYWLSHQTWEERTREITDWLLQHG